MIGINEMHERLIGFRSNLQRDLSALEKINGDILSIGQNIKDTTEARIIFQTALKLAQNQISIGINSIVTVALQSIPFDEDYEFQAKFESKRNQTECDFLFIRDGQEMHPLESCSLGAADVADFALRIAFWKLHGKLRPIIVVDEPVTQLDEDKRPYFATMMRGLSKELGLQLILSTHEKSYKRVADRLLEVRKVNKESEITIHDKEGKID